MIERNPNHIEPQHAAVHQPQIEPALARLSDFDLSLITRKGRLYLMCGQSVDEDQLASVYGGYYAGKRLDPIESLRQAMQPLVETSRPDATMILALVHNMTLYSAGIGESRGYIWRGRQLIQVLPDPRGEALGVPGALQGTGVISGCHFGQRRLYPGDCIILTDARTSRRISARMLRRLGGIASQPSSLAKALAHYARGSQNAHPRLTVIQLPGKAVTPDLPPQTEIEYTKSGSYQTVQRLDIPPILVAVIIAAIAIAIAVIVKRPRITPELIRDILITTPVGTPEATTPPDTPDIARDDVPEADNPPGNN